MSKNSVMEYVVVVKDQIRQTPKTRSRCRMSPIEWTPVLLLFLRPWSWGVLPSWRLMRFLRHVSVDLTLLTFNLAEAHCVSNLDARIAIQQIKIMNNDLYFSSASTHSPADLFSPHFWMWRSSQMIRFSHHVAGTLFHIRCICSNRNTAYNQSPCNRKLAYRYSMTL